MNQSTEYNQTAPFKSIVMLTALASSVGLCNPATHRVVRTSIIPDGSTVGFSETSRERIAALAGTADWRMSFDELVKLTAGYLARRGLYPDYVNRTGEGSYFFHFHTPTQRGLDLYPTGDMVVVVREGQTNHVHEIASGDLGRVANLLTNAGAAA